MITDNYKEVEDQPFNKLSLNLYFLWHAPNFPSILSHWHNRMEILYVVKGSLNVTCGNFTGTVREKELIIVNPDQLHAAIAGETGVHYYALTFDSNLFYNSDNWCNKQYIQPIFCKAVQFQTHICNAEINSILLDIAKEYFRNEFAYELVIEGNVMRLLSILYRYYVKKPEDTVRIDHGFANVLNYVNENFSVNLTTESVAEQFSFNKSYFCRKFKKHTGMSFVDYITYRRLETACSLLRSTNKSITEIATEVGFNDSNYFSRKFYECYGVRPTYLRATAKPLLK